MSVAPPVQGTGAERLPRTLEVIERGRRQELHHGVQLCVRRNGQILADFAAGESPDGGPLTSQTLLPWLSAGKPLTAYALLQWLSESEFADQEWSGLDVPVAAVIPEFGQNGKSAITFLHLLTHTAGLAPIEAGWPQSPWPETISRICEAGLQSGFRIGMDAAYDPQRSWFILGEVLQRRRGAALAELMRRTICDPAGMADAWLAMSPETHQDYGDRIGVVAARNAGGALQPTRGHAAEYCAAPSPGSSWRGPMHDLAAFYEMLRGARPPLMTRRWRSGIFDRTFQHIVDFGLGIIVDSNRYGPETVPYGFGRHCSARTYGHGGAQSSIGFFDDEHALVVAAAANGMPGEPQHQRRFRELCSAIYEDLELGGDV